MPVQLKLSSKLRQTTDTLGARLTAQRNAQIEVRRQAEKETIERQIKEAPLIAKRLIEGLPAFLQKCSDAEYTSAYIVYRLGCQPWEQYFPNFTRPGRNASYNEGNMTEYAIRRYMKGVIQHVALWGLKQSFRVGLGHISRYDDAEREWERHHGVVNVYMPGMFDGYVHTGAYPELLFFAW